MNTSRKTFISKHATAFSLLAVTVVTFGMIGAECPIGTQMPTPTGNDGLTGRFVGSERCAECHSNIHDNWMSTLHSGALETLEAIGQGENDTCLACHTVGFGEEGGFVDRATTNALAGVGCEACHGPSGDHANNVADESLRPPKNIAASICGDCHTGERHPNFEEWEMSGHAAKSISDRFEAGGFYLNSCGKCHSGDFYYMAILDGQTVENDALMGVAVADQNGITCAVCHDPHQRTGNFAVEPDDGRDYQLRFPEVASPVPTNTIDATTNPDRFNICGQCHHGRGRTWQATSRGPHHSVQSNIFVGEMAMPDADDEVTPLVPSTFSVHALATEQCATCHMYRQDFQDEFAPAIAGHSMVVNNAGCAASGCHPTVDAAVAAQATLQTEIEDRLEDITTRLNGFSMTYTEGGALTGAEAWEYSATGGPSEADQDEMPDNIKKIRFLLKYVEGDGSLGIHNPDYVRRMLDEAEDLLDAESL